MKEVKLLTVKEAADQLKLIASNFKQLKQDDSSFEWKYAVTDLDHDGQLELVAAAMHPEDRSTNFKVFELSEKLDHFVSCNVKLEEGESFPDILSDNADAYYNAEKDTWSYLFFDKVILSEDEVYTSKCAVTLKDEAVSYESFAFEHAERIDGVYHVTYMDPDGLPISPESYNAAGVNAFIDCEKSNVNFDWVDVDKFDQKSASDSYAIFNGEKEPEKILPVIPTPSPAPSPAPSASGTADTQPSVLLQWVRASEHLPASRPDRAESRREMRAGDRSDHSLTPGTGCHLIRRCLFYVLYHGFSIQAVYAGADPALL